MEEADADANVYICRAHDVFVYMIIVIIKN